MNEKELKIHDVYSEETLKNNPSILTLEISDPVRKLKSLSELDNKEYRQYFIHLKRITVNNNLLNTIILKDFSFWSRLEANNNQISNVSLRWPKLEKVDLSHNMLNKIPSLEELPNWTELRLNENHIKSIEYAQIKPVKETLIVLELNNNKIDFREPKEFFDFAQLTGDNCRKLKALSVDNNPLISSQVYGANYKNVVVYYCKSLQVLNGMTIEEKERKIYANITNAKSNIIDSFDKFKHEKMFKEEQEDAEIEKKNKLYTMKDIIFEMEKYQTMIRQKQINVRNLQLKIEKYIEQSHDLDIRGIGNNSEWSEEAKEQLDKDKWEFDKFLEKCNNIIESNPKIEGSFFNIVGNLSLIKNGWYSQQSLQFFKHHWFSKNREKAERILAVINETILNKLKETVRDEDIPPDIISGLQEFSNEPLFKNWIKELAIKLRHIVISNTNIKAWNCKAEDMKKWDIFSSAINYWAQLSHDDNILILMLEEESFMKSWAIHWEEFLKYNENSLLLKPQIAEVLINILRIICVLMTYNEDGRRESDIKHYNGNWFRQLLGWKEKVIEKTWDSKLQLYQKSLSDTNQEDATPSYLYLKKIYLGSLIRVYGAWFSKINDPLIIATITIHSSIVSTLLTIYSHSNWFDPVILGAICDCFGYIFTNSLVRSNKGREFTYISNGLHSMKSALQFLVPGSQYHSACIQASKIGQNTIVNNNVVEFDNLSSEVMINLFISIINLMTFFGRIAYNRINTPIKDTCLKICFNLNDSSRDKILTNCLKLPSDEIKKAIVNCLFYVDSSQFEKEELKAIYSQINIGSLTHGEMDFVISNMYIILAKAFWKFWHDPKGEEKEKIWYNKESFNLAYNIWSKNSERITTSDDAVSLRKEMLSISLTVFLINSSSYYQIKKYLCEKDNMEKVSLILFNEEQNLNEKYTLPIEIEKTKPGWSLWSLNRSISGNFSLYPYSFVFLRVMIHVADIMMNICYPSYEIDDYDSFKEIMDKLKSEIIRREEDRIVNEMKTFKEYVNEMKAKKLFKSGENLSIITQWDNEIKEQQNNFISIFPSFWIFIFGRTIKGQKNEFDLIWEDKRDPNFNKLGEYLVEKSLVRSDKVENEDQGNVKNKNIYDSFCKRLREEPWNCLKSNQDTNYGYSHIHLDRLKYKRYGSFEGDFSRVKDEENCNNPYLRGLIISAFLRAIYGVWEYPVDKETKEKMVNLLRKDNTIEQLSLWVDSVKCQFNISSKYLIIMRHILSQHSKKERASSGDDSDFWSQWNIISFMMKKMVRYKQEDINITNQDDKIFLSELSKCASVITNETYALSYPSDWHRENTMTYMINYNWIKMFIDTVIQYMNSEMERLKSGMKDIFVTKASKTPAWDDASKDPNQDNESDEEWANVDDDTLNEMISKIGFILGEYMSKCKSYSYKIWESFTRSYIFNGVNMRKTYWREIIQTCKWSDWTTTLEQHFSSMNNKVKIYFIARCVFYNYNEMSDYVRFILLTDIGMELLQLKLGYNDWETNEWSITCNEQRIDDYVKQKYEDIMKIYQLEIKNRLFIKTKRGYFGLFFMKQYFSDQFIETVRMNNPLIQPPTILAVNLNPSLNKIKTEENVKRKYFLCVFEKDEGFFDFLNVLNKQKDFYKKWRIIKLTDTHLTIFEENGGKYLTNKIEKLLSEASWWNNMDSNGNDEISSFYSKETKEYNLSDLKKVSFSKNDTIELHFNKVLVVKMLDDWSYLSVRKAVWKHLIKKGAESNILERKEDIIVEGNIYSDIN